MFVESTLVVYDTATRGRTALINDPAVDFLMPSTREDWRQDGYMKGDRVSWIKIHFPTFNVATDPCTIALVNEPPILREEGDFSNNGFAHCGAISSASLVCKTDISRVD